MKKLFCTLLAALLIMTIASPIFAVSALESKEVIKFNEDAKVEEWESVKQVVAIGGSIEINGRVEEDAVAIGGSIKLNAGAEVGGDVVALGGSVVQSDKAKIDGDVIELGSPWLESAIKGASASSPAVSIAFKIISTIAMLALLAVLAALFPKQTENILDKVNDAWLKSFGFGVLGLILIVPIIVGLIISLLGIPLIPIFILLVGAAYIMGFVAVAGCIGRRIFKSLKTKKAKPLPLEILLGAAVVILISWVPFIGWLAKLLIVLTGLGGVILTKFGTQKG